MAQFQKGQVANPKGSTGDKKRNDKLIREQLIPFAREFVDRLVALSRSSDESVSLSATKDALDRLYGKASQQVDMTTQGQKIGIVYVGTPPEQE